MAQEFFLQNIGEVVEQVPAVGDLERSRRALACARRVRLLAVAAHHLDLGLPAEPSREGLGLAVRQEFDHMVPLQVDEDGPVDVPTADRPIVPAQLPRERDDQAGQPRGPPGVGRGDLWESLGEDAPRAREVGAEPAPRVQPDPHRDPAPGHVGERTSVPAVDLRGDFAAGGAGDGGAARAGHQGDGRGIGLDGLQVEDAGIGQERRRRHGTENFRWRGQQQPPSMPGAARCLLLTDSLEVPTSCGEVCYRTAGIL